MNNPYIVGRPVRNPENFYGRSEEVEEIFSNVQNLQPVSLVGQRRVGRTSLLQHISNPEIIKNYLDLKKYTIVYVDCEGLIQLSQNQFWKIVLREMMKSLSGSARKSFLPISKKRKIADLDIYSLFQDLSDQDARIVFCFDEFETVTLNENFDPNFFLMLRYLVTSYNNISYITVSCKNLKELTHSRSIQSSPFFNIFNEMRIGFLEWTDTKQLILEPSKREGMEFSLDDADYVFDVAYCHPFFVQATCYEIFNYRKKHQKVRGEKLDHSVYERLNMLLYHKFQSHFEYYWSKLESEEQKQLKEFSTSDWQSRASDMRISILMNSCLLKERNGSYGIFSSIFRKFCLGAELDYQKEVFYE